jgi:hypothetical protein
VRWSADGQGVLLFRALPVKEDDLVRYRIDGDGKIEPSYTVIIPAIQTLLQGEFDIARSTGEVVMTTGGANFDIWTFELENGATAPQQRTSGTTWYGDPAISPDGNHLYYLRGDANGDNLYRLTLPNDEQSLTAQSYPGSTNASVSGNGKYVTFSHVSDSGTIVGVIDVASRQATYTVDHTANLASDPTWILNGYMRIDPKKSALVLRNVSTGATRDVAFPDSLDPLSITANVSGDSVAMIARLGAQSVIVTSPLSAWTPRWHYRSPPAATLSSLSWTGDGAVHFWMMVPGDSTAAIWRVSLANGQAVRRRSLPAWCENALVATGPNAKRGTCASRDMRGDVWLMQVPGLTRK